MIDLKHIKNYLEHWKRLTKENLEKREVGEIVCKVDDKYELISSSSPLDCKARGGEPVAFFHNHPSKYTGIDWGEPRLSYGDIGWGILNKMPIMCVGADTKTGIRIRCFCADIDKTESLRTELLTAKNPKEIIARENPYKECLTY